MLWLVIRGAKPKPALNAAASPRLLVRLRSGLSAVRKSPQGSATSRISLDYPGVILCSVRVVGKTRFTRNPVPINCDSNLPRTGLSEGYPQRRRLGFRCAEDNRRD